MPETGDTAHILAGPFRDFIGTVTAAGRQHGLVRLTISFYGRDTPVELAFEYVEKL